MTERQTHMIDPTEYRRQVNALEAAARAEATVEVSKFDGSNDLFDALTAAEAAVRAATDAVTAHESKNAALFATKTHPTRGVTSIDRDAKGVPLRALGADVAKYEKAVIDRAALTAAVDAARARVDKASAAWRDRPSVIDRAKAPEIMDAHLSALLAALPAVLREAEAVAAFAKAAGTGYAIPAKNGIADAVIELANNVARSVATAVSLEELAQKSATAATIREGLRYVPKEASN